MATHDTRKTAASGMSLPGKIHSRRPRWRTMFLGPIRPGREIHLKRTCKIRWTESSDSTAGCSRRCVLRLTIRARSPLLPSGAVSSGWPRTAGEGVNELLLRRQEFGNAAQCEGVAGDAEAGDDALADRGGLRGRAAADRVRDVHLDRRAAHLGNRRHQRRIAAAEGRRVEDRRIDTAIVRLVQLVDNLAFDV